MKKLILIRHGNTPKSNRTPERGLTMTGVKRIKETSKNIREEVVETKHCLIISTPTNRAIQTADIIASELGITHREIDNVRILNLGNLSEILDSIKLKGGSLCEYYWGINNYDKVCVESPIKFTNRVGLILSSYFGQGYECIIVVTHEISLETIVEYSDNYTLKRKSYEGMSGYGDFAILETLNSDNIISDNRS